MFTQNFTLRHMVLLLAAIVFQTTLSTAQNPFVKLYGDQGFQNLGKVEVHDNALFAVGLSGDGNNIFANFSRFDLSGVLQWTVQLPEFNTGFSDFIRCDEDGNFLLIGSTYPRFNPNTNNMSVLAKITPAGNVLWWRRYPNNGREGFSRIVRNPAPGNALPYYIVAIENTNNNPGTSDVVTLYNLDFNGNIGFKRRYTGADAQFSNTLLAYPDGTMAMGGEDLTTGRIAWVYANGNPQFANSYGPQFISWRDLKLYSNNGAIGVGTYWNLGNNDQDGLIARLDQNGRQVWAARIPNIQSFYRVTQPDDSGIFYALGYTDGITPQRNIAVKFQETAGGIPAVLWSRHLDGGESAYIGGFLGLAPNGNLLFADGRADNPGGFGLRDGLLAVLNPEFESDCTQDYPVEITPLQMVVTPVQVPVTSPPIPTPLTLQTAVNLEWQTTAPCATGGCGECATDEIVINTGYDPVSGSTYPAGSYDGLWSLVESPDAGITVPRPAYVVTPNTAWANQTNTGWISAYPQSNLNSNNPKPNPPYGFKRCFCICQDDSDITISLNALADNNVDIYLEDEFGNDIPPTILSITNTGVGAFQTVTSGTMSYTLNTGTYCLRADLRNLSGVAMGLNIQGSITGENLVETLCCTDAGGITGAKFYDQDCNGEWNNPGPNGEPGIPGWQIVLCDTLGNPLDTVLTDAFGYYTFPNVTPGVYMVKEINQPGWTPSVPPTGAYTIVVDPLQIAGPVNFGNCRSCGDFVEEEVNFSCDPLGSYEYTFQMQNHTGDLVTSFVLNNLPAGYTFTPQYFSQWTNPAELPIAPNGGISGPLSITITPPAPITEPTEICFDVVLFSGANECCHFRHCITLEPIDPCQVEVIATAVDSDEGCCYDITVTNDYCDNFFTVLVTEILTPGVVFSAYNGGSTWNVTEDNLNHRLSWAPAAGGNIPTGTFGDMQICLGGIMSQTQKPQYVAFHWMSVNAAGEEYIACSDTLEFNCEGCVIVSEENIVCNEDGTYSYSMTVTNNSNPAHFVSNVVLEVYSTTIAFTPNVFNVALNGGQSAPIGPITITGGNPGDVVWFKTLILDTDGWCCHLDSLSITLPDCGGCDCPPFEEYVQNANAGFTFTEDCPEVNFTAVAGTECDLVDWQFFLPGQPPVAVQGKGDETISFTFPGPGGYGVCMTLIPINADGKRCYDEAIQFCQDIVITCDQNVDCIDPTQIDLTFNCPAIFEPVCGCDGVTYSNSCAAENWGGVTSWTAGACPQDPNGPNNPNVISQPQLDETIQETRPQLPVGLNGKHRLRFAGLMRALPDGTWEAMDIQEADTDLSGVKLNPDQADLSKGQYEIWATDDKGRLFRAPANPVVRPLSLNLYPNPVREELILSFGNEGRYNVELFNANGARMMTRTIEGFNATMPVDQLPDGVYILRAMDEQGRITQQRFVKTAR